MTHLRPKPTKPYPSFPLTTHPNGQWCKKLRGKVHFFGVWADPGTALKRYLAQASDLHAGRQPRLSTVSTDEPTVKEVCNVYLNHQRERMEAGEIGPCWFEDCRKILRAFGKAAGSGHAVGSLRPEDFRKYRNRLSRQLGLHAQN